MYTLILVSLALIGNGNVYGLAIPYRCEESYTLNYDFQRCFKAFEQPELAFLDARDACEKDRGDLATVHIDDGDNDLIRDLLAEGRRYWIGFTKANVTEGSRLVSLYYGDDVSFTVPWASGEPNNLGGNEACVEIIGNEQGTWNDKECSAKRPFVCMHASIFDPSLK